MAGMRRSGRCRASYAAFPLRGLRWSPCRPLDTRRRTQRRRSLVDQVRMRAVESPSEVLEGRGSDEEWFYLEGAGLSRWLKVVVVFDRASSGRIITAFGRRRKP